MDVVDYVKKILGDMVKNVEVGKDVVQVEVDISNIRDAAKKMKEAGFDHAKDVTAVHDKKEGKIRIIYHLSSYTNPELAKTIVGIYYTIPESQDRVPTLYDIYTSVDFLEREIYEGFGIYFEGHPDMRPLLLAPTVAELKPMRRDFIVKEENIFKVKK